MNEVYVIQSELGDEYKIQLTTECSGLISRKEHLKYANMIAERQHKDFDK